ncbi:MAG: tetratricopeptide repeat protein [Ignavibacteria bacterium]|nr:tetratricopeptide repeat protein [Ignavibacteria bacterium]
MLKLNYIHFYILLVLIIFSACSTSKIQQESTPDYSQMSLFELYLQANQLDSNTIRYIKNNYLLDLIINASKNEQLGLYHQAIVDLLDALRFDSSKVILYSLAKNLYMLEKYTLAFDYAFKSYLKDTNFLPTIELLAYLLRSRNQPELALYFSTRLIHIKKDKLTEEDLNLHLSLLDKVDTSYSSSINFLRSFSQKSLSSFTDLNLLLYYVLVGDTINQFNYCNKIIRNTKNYNELSNTFWTYYFELIKSRYSFEEFCEQLRKIGKELTFENALFLSYSLFQSFKQQDENNFQLLQQYSNCLENFLEDNYKKFYLLREIALTNKDTAKAEEYTQKILSGNNIDFDILSNITYYQFISGKKKEAIDNLRKFEFAFDTNTNYYNLLAELYLNDNQFDLARETLEKCIALDSANIDAHINLGWLYYEIEEHTLSDLHYAKALMLDPENPLILNNWAYSYIQRDTNLKEAREMIEKALEYRSENPNFLDTYGWLFYKLKDYEKAKKFIEKSIQLDSSRPEPFLHLSLIYEAMGDTENAKKFFDKALQIDPNNKEVRKEIENKTK